MGSVSLPWLNGGAPTEIRQVPLNGQREILNLSRKKAKVVVAKRDAFAVFVKQAALETKRALDAKGEKDAKAAWDATRRHLGLNHEELEWPEEGFGRHLQAYLEDHVFRSLDVSNAEEARAKLKGEAAKASATWDALEDEIVAYELDSIALEVYWALKATGISEVTPPGRAPIALSWEPADKARTLESLGEVVQRNDRIAILQALYSPKEAARLDWDDLQPAPEEVVVGNSNPASASSTPGNGGSTLSLASPTATLAPSGTSATWSGSSSP